MREWLWRSSAAQLGLATTAGREGFGRRVQEKNVYDGEMEHNVKEGKGEREREREVNEIRKGKGQGGKERQNSQIKELAKIYSLYWEA